MKILEGAALVVLPELEAASVRTCVTSPPYWGLRDYGDPDQIGLEATPEEYVAHLVDVFREVRRVLTRDGTVWLNLGDTYNAYNGNRGESPGFSDGAGGRDHPTHGPGLTAPGLKPKDLVGIPWRVAFALQADGWFLRSDIVWAKPNPMPESVTDRPTKAHEYLFLLSKRDRYYFDLEAWKEDAIRHERTRPPFGWGVDDEPRTSAKLQREGLHPKGREVASRKIRTGAPVTMRNRRSVWTISPEPFPGAHFAVMPQALVEPCILAGSKPGDTVLDPFAGSGTVGVVALRHGREFVGVELNPEYARMARARISGPLFS